MMHLQHILNSLKNGVVPEYGIDYLCVGREEQLAEITRGFSSVKENGGVVKVVSGPYGAGKTFFLQRIKMEALRSNFIVASLKINQGFRFNHIEHFYYNIMHNLSLLDKGETETSFEDIFDRWINKVREMPSDNASSEINKILGTLEKYNASFARALTYYIRARIKEDKEFSGAIASWISGEKNIPSQLKTKFEVIGSVDKVNTMDFLKAFIKLTEFMGFEGLVILIDEVELIMNERANIRSKAYENIRYIIDECSIGELKNVMFVFAATDELLTNTEKGIYSYEALYQRLGDPVEKKSKVIKDLRQPVISLPKLSEDDMSEITKKVLEMHKEVYNIEPSISIDSITNWALYMYKDVEPTLNIKSVNLRKFVIKVMEVLDAMEQNSDISLLRSELKRIDNNGEMSFKAVPVNG